MCSRSLVVGKITLQSPAQRPFIPYHDVVQTFPPDGTDQPLDVRILPWRSRRGNYFFHPQTFRHGDPVTTVDRIAVTQKISAPVVPGKSLPYLLHGPFLAGVFVNLKCNNAGPAWGNKTKTNQNPKGPVRNSEKFIEALLFHGFGKKVPQGWDRCLPRGARKLGT